MQDLSASQVRHCGLGTADLARMLSYRRVDLSTMSFLSGFLPDCSSGCAENTCCFVTEDAEDDPHMAESLVTTLHAVSDTVHIDDSAWLGTEITTVSKGVENLQNEEQVDGAFVEEQQDPDEYHVHLRKTDLAERVGISLRGQRNGMTIGAVVIALKGDTMITEWNRMHPEDAVEVGDRLLMINSVPVRLVSDVHVELAKVQDIHLRLLRRSVSGTK